MFGILELACLFDSTGLPASVWRPADASQSHPSIAAVALRRRTAGPGAGQRLERGAARQPVRSPATWSFISISRPMEPPARSTFTASCCCSLTAFPIACGSSARSKSSTPSSKASKKRGELELEQAYLDFLVTPALNFRAGMMLVPVGIINERHEPPVFHGVERPFVDTVIVPTTWFEAGAGIHGAFGRRLPLSGLCDGAARRDRNSRRARGCAAPRSRDRRRRCATSRSPAARVCGHSRPAGRRELLARRHRVQRAAHRFEDRRLRGRCPLHQGTPRNAGAACARVHFRGRRDERRAHAHDRHQSQHRQAVERHLRGSGLPRAAGTRSRTMRRCSCATRTSTPSSACRTATSPLPQFDRDAWVAGATYWVDPDVAIKVDYSHVRSRSAFVPAPRTFNVGLGWWF